MPGAESKKNAARSAKGAERRMGERAARSAGAAAAAAAAASGKGGIRPITFFKISDKGKPTKERAARLKDCLAPFDLRSPPAADDSGPRHSLVSQEEVTAKTRFLVLGSHPSTEHMDAAFREWFNVRLNTRALPISVLTLDQFIARVASGKPPEEWPECEPPDVYARRFFGAENLYGVHALRSWYLHNVSRDNLERFVFGSDGTSRLASGGYLDALLCLQEAKRERGATPIFEPKDNGCSWSLSYAQWDRSSVFQQWDGGQLASAEGARLLSDCNGKGGLLGEIMLRMRRCEAIHNHRSMAHALVNSELTSLAHVVEHALLQQRAAITARLAMLAIQKGDTEEAMRICEAHDDREQLLATKAHATVRFPDVEDDKMPWLAEHGIPLLGTWARGYGVPGADDVRAVRDLGLVEVDGRSSYDLRDRNWRLRNLTAHACMPAIRDHDRTTKPLNDVGNMHLQWKRYERVFPSKEIGAFVTFLTEELPQRCAAQLPHIAAALARGGEGEKDVNVRVATWAAFGCPRSIDAFTHAVKDMPGRRAVNEFKQCRDLGVCLPMNREFNNLLPEPTASRNVSAADVLAMIVRHLDALTRLAHSDVDRLSWGNLLAPLSFEAKETLQPNQKVAVLLVPKEEVVEGAADTTRAKVTERSWSALCACLRATEGVTSVKRDVKSGELSFSLPMADWEAAKSVQGGREKEARTMTRVVAWLRGARAAVAVDPKVWRPSKKNRDRLMRRNQEWREQEAARMEREQSRRLIRAGVCHARQQGN